jgi:starch-binding outer membrane protein, SusD/RagB family
MKTFRYIFLFTAITTILFSGCESLDVKNENDPDFATAFSKPSDVKGVAGGLINTWYTTTTAYNGPGLALLVGADAGTCSHGNAAMRDFSYEPRIAWDNTPSYSNAVITENFYKGIYSLLSSSNEILVKVVKEGMTIMTESVDETPLVKAIAYLGQGLALGYVGLFFDKGFVVTEETDLTQVVQLSEYKDLITTAVESLDKCIAVCSSSQFQLPPSWIPGKIYTQVEIGQLANTMAARLLSYSPRNKADNDAVDWQKVLAYANNGITFDFSPENDSWVSWYGEYQDYANAAGWGRMDMRLAHMMDPAMPERWTLGADQWAALPAPTLSHKDGVDDRIFTDCEYLSSCTFRVERGYYHYSCYRYKVYESFHSDGTGPMPVVKKAENDLLKAEALLKTAGVSQAAQIINAGTRVTRGKLAPVAATANEVEAAIWHERFIELYCSAMGNEFCFMRKADKLQPGTPLHFPIPGQQLEVNLMEPYSFGPNKGTSAKDFSAGGWF